jgi:hypothetical protein
MMSKSPEGILLRISERKVSRLRKENSELKETLNSIRLDYIELLKVIADESNKMEEKVAIKKLINALKEIK